ncbi:MAG: LpxD N-terminal domain-containing protein, partial [Pseudomonadota bacterium]
MVDSRFFDYSGQITLKQLVDITGVKTESIDKENLIVKDVAPLDKAGISEVSFLDNIKYVEMFSKSKAGFCFVDEKHKAHAPDGMILLITKEPYHAFALASQQFYPPYKT